MARDHLLESSISDLLLSDDILLADDVDPVAHAATILKVAHRPAADVSAFDVALKAVRDIHESAELLDRGDLQGVAETHAFKILNAPPLTLEPGDKASEEFYLQAELETPVYWPEHSDAPVAKVEFLSLASGNAARALALFGGCEWQHPATLVDEHGEGFFGDFEVDHILYGNHDQGMFLVLYDKSGVPLYKDNAQDRGDIIRLLGKKLGQRVLDDAGEPQSDMPPNYRKIQLRPDELYFSDEREASPVAAPRF